VEGSVWALGLCLNSDKESGITSRPIRHIEDFSDNGTEK